MRCVNNMWKFNLSSATSRFPCGLRQCRLALPFASLLALAAASLHAAKPAVAESTAPTQLASASTLLPAQFQLMPVEKLKSLRSGFPEVASPDIQAVLNDPGLILYTDEEIPPAFQNWSGALPGVHDPHFNISADRKEPFGNANREFPWGRPLGTHRSGNVETFRFLYLPPREDASHYPVVYFQKRYQGDRLDGYAWCFPIGAVVGEVLGMQLPDGRIVTFELRVRIREQADWAVDVFRPFPNAQSLATRIQELEPDWNQNESLRKLVAHLEGPTQLALVSLRDQQPLQRVFNGEAGVDSLPPIDNNELLVRLLSETTFQSCLGQDWRVDLRGNKVNAPTTEAQAHIVPRHYDAGFVQVDRIECAQCHKTVGQHADDFDLKRDWYGRVRGSDGIFSFHPFDPACISKRGLPGKAIIRQDLENAGVIAVFNPTVHTAERYTVIPELVK